MRVAHAVPISSRPGELVRAVCGVELAMPDGEAPAGTPSCQACADELYRRARQHRLTLVRHIND